MDGKETEAALAMERALLDEIFRHTPASMAIWRGPDLKLEHVNPGYLALFPGRPLLGMRPHEAFPETRDQPLGGYLNGVYETGQPHVGRETLVRHRRREGGPIQKCYYDFAYLRINGSDKRPYGVYDFAIDVTERVLARQELERKQHELEGANADLRSEREMRDNFVALLTHDLRTPLNVAMMNAHLAIRKVANPQDVITHASKTIDAIGRHWSCDDVLRAIDNLGSNAAKYGDTTRPITVTIRAHHDVVDIMVHNHGNPISADELPTLFDRFMRTTSSGGEAQGWGLGLSLVRGVAEAHGGSVEVESAPGDGTTFTLRLPLDSCAAR